MVLLGNSVITTNSDENSFIDTDNLLNVKVSAVLNSAKGKTFSGLHLQPTNKKNFPIQQLGSQLKSNWILQKRPARVTAMQNTSNNHNSPSSNSEDSISRSLKMKIKRKSGAHKSEDKHEIVNTCEVGESRDKTLKGKRERIRVKSGTSSSECDPYEFGAKTDDDELPVKRMKLEPIVENHATKEVGINAITLGTMTEPDMLGPCEPGSTICLNGIVWLETDTGLLVINVTWRGRTYVGTLLDATKHDFAPPCPRDYVSPIESRNPPRGRGKRRGGNIAQTYRNTRGAKSRVANCRSMTSASNSQPNTPTDSDEDIKRSQSRRNSPTESASDASDATYPISCPQPSCCKRFADMTALRFHMNQVHTKKHVRSISTSHCYAKSGVVRSLSAEGGLRRRSPIKKRDHSRLTTKNHYLEVAAVSPVACTNSVDYTNRHSVTSSPHSECASIEETLFKTPTNTSPVCTTNSILVPSSRQTLSPVSALSLQNSCVPLPPGVNSTSTDASTFSLLSSSSPVCQNTTAKNSLPTLNNGSQTGVRTVTAHTVAIPVDKSPIPSHITSPVKKKSSDDHKKTTLSVVKRNNVVAPVIPTTSVSSSFSSISVSNQRPIVPSTTSPVLGLPPSAPSPSSVAQVIALSATVASKPLGPTTNTCTVLKPIQPKPISISGQHVLNNNSLNIAPASTHSVSGILHDGVPNNTPLTTDKKPKKIRKRDPTEVHIRKNYNASDCSAVEKAGKKKSESKLNGLSGHNKSSVNDNPVSPAYSDISEDANDSPAPVLEKEVDVKGNLDRVGTSLEDGVIIGNVGSGFNVPTFFSQPPSLVPAVSGQDKLLPAIIPSSTSSIETLSEVDQVMKDKQEETRQIMRENHDLKAHVPVVSCERRLPSTNDCAQGKKDPPALTKIKDDFKPPPNNATPPSSTPPAIKIKETPVSKSSNCRPKSTEPFHQSPSSASPSTHFSVPRSDVFNIPTPTSNAFGSINFADYLPPGSNRPHQLPCHPFDPFMGTFPNPSTNIPGFNPHFPSNFDFSGVPHGPLVPPLLPPNPNNSGQHKIHELAEQAKDPQQPSPQSASITPSHSHQQLPSPIAAVSSRHSSPTPVSGITPSLNRGRKSPADLVAALNLRHSASLSHLPHPGHMFAPQPPFGPPHGPHMQPAHPMSLQEQFFQNTYMMPGSLYQHK